MSLYSDIETCIFAIVEEISINVVIDLPQNVA